jgi:tetratricopeptide (TPR) repeat protein
MSTGTWNEGSSAVCESFQLDLSCLLDRELDSEAAGRAVVHMEACTACREFFEDTRSQIRIHRDLAEPDRLFARVAMLTGASNLGVDAIEGIDLVHRLATIFYQLGKAYVLASIDPGYRERVFEAAVPLESAQVRGRGFVDGVVMNGKETAGGLDWKRARSMLNGRLEKIESPLEKGRRLLEEAIAADPSHEEAQLYLAFLHAHEGRRLLAAEEYRRIFDTGLDDRNRGHAAIQLGRPPLRREGLPEGDRPLALGHDQRPGGQRRSFLRGAFQLGDGLRLDAKPEAFAGLLPGAVGSAPEPDGGGGRPLPPFLGPARLDRLPAGIRRGAAPDLSGAVRAGGEPDAPGVLGDLGVRGRMR